MENHESEIATDFSERPANMNNAEKRRVLDAPPKPRILVEVHRVPHLPLPTRYPR